MFELHHVGIVVEDVEETVSKYMQLFDGFKVVSRDVVESEQVKVLLLGNETNTIELIEPISRNSPVFDFLSKGGGLHHLCFATDDIDTYIANNRTRIKVIKGKHKGFFGLNTAFFVQRQIKDGMVLVELVEI